MDYVLLKLLNGMAGQSALLDGLVRQVVHNQLFKGIFVSMVLVALWAWRGGDAQARRAGVIATIVVSVLAIFVGRGLANMLPYSHRPIHTEGVPVNMPFGVNTETLEGWSSMPSDHAVLFFSIAVCIFMISRWVGVLMLLHAIFIVALPRVYLGLHWPSDIVAGMIIGAAIALVVFGPLQRLLLRGHAIDLAERYAVLAYPVLFLAFLQIGTNFDSLRKLASAVAQAMKSVHLV